MSNIGQLYLCLSVCDSTFSIMGDGHKTVPGIEALVMIKLLYWTDPLDLTCPIIIATDHLFQSYDLHTVLKAYL